MRGIVVPLGSRKRHVVLLSTCDSGLLVNLDQLFGGDCDPQLEEMVGFGVVFLTSLCLLSVRIWLFCCTFYGAFESLGPFGGTLAVPPNAVAHRAALMNSLRLGNESGPQASQPTLRHA